MDKAIIKYYRTLLKEEFPNSGELEAPSVFIEAIGERLINCGNTGNYMQLFLNIVDRQIEAITYLCQCEPVANVAAEVLCTLVKGLSVDQAASLEVDRFYEVIGTQAQELQEKVRGLLELLNEGLAPHLSKGTRKKQDEQDKKLSWDEVLST